MHADHHILLERTQFLPPEFVLQYTCLKELRSSSTVPISHATRNIYADIICLGSSSVKFHCLLCSIQLDVNCNRLIFILSLTIHRICSLVFTRAARIYKMIQRLPCLFFVLSKWSLIFIFLEISTFLCRVSFLLATVALCILKFADRMFVSPPQRQHSCLLLLYEDCLPCMTLSMCSVDLAEFAFVFVVCKSPTLLEALSIARGSTTYLRKTVFIGGWE